MTWSSDEQPAQFKINKLGWVRIFVRGLTIGALTFGCLGILILVRLFERPIYGQGRPITPYITQFVCRSALILMGIRYERKGHPMVGAGAVVANHSSWLDIFALNAAQRIYFVSKAEVSRWPGIGWLARATGTVFIARDRTQAATQVQIFKDRMLKGHQLLFFPEGTSTDGQQVLAFKPTLFAAFFDDALRNDTMIQPVSVIYTAPKGSDARLYGWWGDMDFGPHLLTTLAQAPQGHVTVIYHEPVPVSDFEDRKMLAAHLENIVGSGHSKHLTHESGKAG